MPEAPPPKTKKPRRILARSLDYARDKGLIEIALSKPSEGEECGITLEPIAEARLDFLPADANPSPVATHAGRELRKATLPCGHSFSAVAVLYHFAKNGMRCPNCRAGVEARMTPQSIPQHLRAAFVGHIERESEAERQEQVHNDMRLATELLEREVNGSSGASFYLDRVVVSVYAYDGMDSLAPVSVQALPLRMMRAPGDRSLGGASGGGRSSWTGARSPSPSRSGSSPTLSFEAAGYSCRQLSINLRLMGADVRAFELVVGARDIFDGLVMLCRTARFPAERGSGLVECVGHGLALDVRSSDGRLEGVGWTVPQAELVRALASSAVVGALDPPRLPVGLIEA